MKNLYLISILMVGMLSCNPCKRIAKHPECFPVDTVRETEYVMHYQTETITKDSFIIDTINTLIQKTIYQTKTIVKVDTVYKEKYISKINPINKELEIKINQAKIIIDDQKKVINIWRKRTGFISIGLLILLGFIFIQLKFKL